jgi:SAM-dependent methyltransferase
MNNAQARSIQKKKVLTCPLCGSPERSFIYEGFEHEYENTTNDGFPFYRCLDCSLVYLSPRPNESELSQIYPPNYYSHVANNAHPTDLKLETPLGMALHLRLIKRVSKNIQPHIQMCDSLAFLDVGCGNGRALGSLHHEFGFKCTGIDFAIPDALIDEFKAPPIRLIRGNFMDFDFKGDNFDIIYASHLIEHLDNPISFLEKAGSLLKPGGICVIETPNEKCWAHTLFGKHWGGNHTPRHWFILNPVTSTKAAEILPSQSLRVDAIRFSHNSAFWIWSFHSFLKAILGYKIASILLPSDHRIVSPNLFNLLRHGVFTVLDIIILKVSGRTGNMSVTYKKIVD